jgi:hypothetical protein
MDLNGKISVKKKNLLVGCFVLALFAGQLFWYLTNLSKSNKHCEEEIEWQNEELKDYHANFNFQCKIEGQEINSNLELYSVRNEEYISYNDFINKYVCVFHLAEIGCNECYINEFYIMREVFKDSKLTKKVAIITNTKEREFITKLIKDYAPDFDVYQIENGFLEKDNKIEVPFFMQFNSNGVCYNVHRSSKLFEDLTYLYVENLKSELD